MELITSLFAQYTLVEWLLAGSLLLLFLIHLLFCLLLYRKPYTYERKRKVTAVAEEELPGISVIISSKNNSEELAKNLPFILEQDYPLFEVIVVNCGSTDETDMVLKAAEQKYPHLYHTYVPADSDGTNEKKLSLTLGIKAAKHEILLFTEAYCRPVTTRWIREYGKAFLQERDIVLGYSRLIIEKKVWMRKFIHFDNLVHHLKFISMALAHKPFMGIGRNMAYKKALFYSHKGFSPILNIEGGEDDLYINRIAQRKTTGVVMTADSMTDTRGIDSFFTWRSIKSKYLYTKQFYRGFAFHLLGVETVTKYAFYLAFLAIVGLAIMNAAYYLAAFALLLTILRFLVLLVIINKNSVLFDGSKYHLNLFFFELFQPFNNLRFRKYANRRNNTRR